MKKYYSIIMCCAFFACSTTEQKTNVTEYTPAKDSAAVSTGKECYESISGKDTVQLSFTKTNDQVVGELVYNFFEKDKNSGIINGKFYGDTLIADYQFMSEGVRSIREVAFIKKGSKLTEGYGESMDNGGNLKFKDHKNLKFTSAIQLTAISCK